jgi:hypothetical protein
MTQPVTLLLETHFKQIAPGSRKAAEGDISGLCRFGNLIEPDAG